MNISEKKKTELYSAISDTIMENRIAISNSKNVLGEKNAADLDAMMFKLTNDIWHKVKKALNIIDN